MKRPFLLVSALLFASVAFSSDIITLNTQMVFEGKVTKIKNCNVIFKSDGMKYKIPADDVYSLQFGDVSDKVLTQYLELSNMEGDACMNGKMDADNYHGKEWGHAALGFFFGPFAMIGTAIAQQTPEKGKETSFASKNKDQFSDPAYLSCYKKKAKGKLIGMEAAGWGAAILLILIIS